MDEKDLGGIFKDFYQIGLAFVIAVFFGFIRYLQEFIVTDAPAKFRWFVAVAKSLIAGAAGMATMWLMLEWHVGPYLSAFLVAIAGYGGAETLQVLKEVFYDFIRRKANASANEPPKS